MNSIQLHSVVEFVRNGATIKQDKNRSLGIPITRIETISNSVFNYDRLGYANIQDDTYSKYYLYDNDVLLSHINSEKFLGRSVLYKLDPAITPIIHGMNLLCIRFHKQVYNPAFFVWYTKSNIAKDYFKIHTKRAVNQASITSTAIKEMPIPDVNINEQNAIVCELDKIQETLANKNEQLKKLDELIQSKFYEMFGDPIINDKEWEPQTIGKIGKVVTGNTPSRTIASYYNGKYIEWIKSDNIINGELYPSKAKEYLSEEGMMKGRVVDENSILVTCIAGSLSSIGGCCLTDRKVAFNQQINAIIPNKEVNSKFVCYYIMLAKELIRNKASQGMKHIISKSSFEELPIILPPLPLQQAFASYVEKVEEAKAIVNQEIAHLQELFDSRMDYYFRK